MDEYKSSCSLVSREALEEYNSTASLVITGFKFYDPSLLNREALYLLCQSLPVQEGLMGHRLFYVNKINLVQRLDKPWFPSLCFR